MDTLETRIDTADAGFAANAANMEGLLQELKTAVATARRGGSEKAHARHEEQGKLFVRDRIAKLLDHGTPFLELSPLAAHGLYDNAAPAAGGLLRLVHLWRLPRRCWVISPVQLL